MLRTSKQRKQIGLGRAILGTLKGLGQAKLEKKANDRNSCGSFTNVPLLCSTSPPKLSGLTRGSFIFSHVSAGQRGLADLGRAALPPRGSWGLASALDSPESPLCSTCVSSSSWEQWASHGNERIMGAQAQYHSFFLVPPNSLLTKASCMAEARATNGGPRHVAKGKDDSGRVSWGQERNLRESSMSFLNSLFASNLVIAPSLMTLKPSVALSWFGSSSALLLCM